ncbi:hypothetical protein CASFOL_027393 [Castilleja foliolosa]|uniref:Uncharacterized protein n=1 Tax=Castilleja foliolosa TaxID=1961234 RepID=A0ABD3CFJ6_9LAMI
MGFWRQANEEFSDIVHRMANNMKKMLHGHGLSAAEIRKRMAGIPAYKLSNYTDNKVFINSDHDENKRFPLHFITKPDALDFLETAKLHYDLERDWRIVDTPLSDVIDDETIRFVPDLLQIKNAIKEKGKEKDMPASDDKIFIGVPIFKTSEFTLEVTGEIFRPAFLRKEDLQERLAAMNISPEDSIEVGSLEETIQEMKDRSTSKSNDILFIGLGDTSWTWLHEHQ